MTPDNLHIHLVSKRTNKSREDAMTDMEDHAIEVEQPRYPHKKLNGIEYLAGTRVYRVHTIRNHIPRLMKLFGRQIKCVYDAQPEENTQQQSQHNSSQTVTDNTESETDTETQSQRDTQTETNQILQQEKEMNQNQHSMKENEQNANDITKQQNENNVEKQPTRKRQVNQNLQQNKKQISNQRENVTIRKNQ